jgi:hypothetical protein
MAGTGEQSVEAASAQSLLLVEAAWPPAADRARVVEMNDVEFLHAVEDVVGAGDVGEMAVVQDFVGYGGTSEWADREPDDALPDAVMLAVAQRTAQRLGWMLVPDPVQQERLAQ